MTHILFVCLGNICRSPAAEGMLLHIALKQEKAQDLFVESCGLGDWHQGQLPDQRIRHAAEMRGITLSSRAKAFHPHFFERFDYILAADRAVMNELYTHAKSLEDKSKIHLITAFSSSYQGEDIPDPYYFDHAAFDLVLDMLEDCCEGILKKIQKENFS